MSDNSLNRLEDLFLLALEQPHHLRAAWLESACAGHDRTREMLVSLLSTHDAEGPFILNYPIPGDAPGRHNLLGDSAREASAADKPGHYVLLRSIGAGGMGIVFLACETEPIQRLVALKLLRRELQTATMLQHFACERQSLALMQHPAIPRIFNAGKMPDGQEFLAMEYFDGQNILQFCQQSAVSEIDCVALFVKVCEAVEYIHRKGVVHRDIKPSNVLVVVEDGIPEPRLIDFGIAATMQNTGYRSDHEPHSAQVFGSVDYMSPEQSRPADDHPDPRTDIYSLGALLYELITQSTPFAEWQRCSIKQRLAVLREQVPTSLKDRLKDNSLPVQNDAHTEQLNHVTMKCLAREPADRYQTAGELVDDLQTFLTAQPVISNNKSRRDEQISRMLVVSSVLSLLVAATVILSHHYETDVASGLAESSPTSATLQQDTFVSIPIDAYKSIDRILRENGVETGEQAVILPGNAKTSRDVENKVTLVPTPAINSKIAGDALVARPHVTGGHSG